MKKYILTLLILISLKGFGQGIDSTQIPQTVLLELEQVCYVKDCMGNVGEVQYVRFYKQVAAQVDTATYNPAQLISITVPSWFVREVYASVSRQPEGVANPINDEIKAALLPQLTNPWLLNALYQIGVSNATQRTNKITNGYNYFKGIK